MRRAQAVKSWGAENLEEMKLAEVIEKEMMRGMMPREGAVKNIKGGISERGQSVISKVAEISRGKKDKEKARYNKNGSGEWQVFCALLLFCIKSLPKSFYLVCQLSITG